MNTNYAPMVKDAPLMSVFGEPVTRKDVARIVKGIVLVTCFLSMIWFSLEQWQIAVQDFREWWNKPVTQQGRPEPTREQLQRAHKFHGTLHSFEDKNHVWYFYNKEGRKCKLFAYLKNKNK